MSRHRTKGMRSVDRHVRLYHWLMGSPAWKSLPSTARALYAELAKHYHGTNNGKISYSVREAAEDLGISLGFACKMFRVLQQLGFIVAVEKGAFSLKVRHATTWRLTEFTCDLTGALPTKDFMRWRPSQDLEHGITRKSTRFTRRYRTVSPREQMPAPNSRLRFTT